MADLSVIIHGGAGGLSPVEEQNQQIPVLKQAVDAAWNALISGQPGERAVSEALRVLEACEYFNAGYGSFPDENGVVRCDVGLMRGNGDFISFMNMRRIKYPSEIACREFERRKNLMAVWTEEMMVKLDDAEEELKIRAGWVPEEQDMLAPWAKKKAAERAVKLAQTAHHGTVGCVVRDGCGRIFAGTSTGGVMFKPPGRVGDSPIIGAGVYADDEVCGLSATGGGEVILKSLLSGYVIADIRSFLRADGARLEKDRDLLKKILSSELSEMRKKFPNGEAGLIVIPAHGEPAYAFNSKMMSVGLRVGNADRVRYEDFLFAQ